MSPALAFNGCRVQANIDFTVGAGGGGITRLANLFCRVSKAFDFTGVGGSSGDSVTGTGTGKGTNFVQTAAGITSSDLNAGNVFVGFYVTSSGADAGNGTFRISNINLTTYWGTSVPSPPGGSIFVTLVNPAANYTPGKYNGSNFDSVQATLTGPLPQSFFNFVWTIVGNAGIKFAANNTQSLTQAQGTSGNPGNPYFNQTGVITIAQGTPPGTYSLLLDVQGISGQTFQQSSNLIVVPSSGGILSEF